MLKFPEAGTAAVYHTSEERFDPQLGVPPSPEFEASTIVPAVLLLQEPEPTVKAIALAGSSLGGVCE